MMSLSVTTGAGGQEVDLPTSGVVTEPITIPEIVNAMTGTATVIDNDKNRTFEAVVCGDKTFHNYPNGYNYLMTPHSRILRTVSFFTTSISTVNSRPAIRSR